MATRLRGPKVASDFDTLVAAACRLSAADGVSVLDGGPEWGGAGFLAAWPERRWSVRWLGGPATADALAAALREFEAALGPHGPLGVVALGYEVAAALAAGARAAAPTRRAELGAPVADLALYPAWIEMDWAAGDAHVRWARGRGAQAEELVANLSRAAGRPVSRKITRVDEPGIIGVGNGRGD